MSEGDAHRLITEHTPTGSPTRAVLEDMDGHTVQCYRMSTGTKNARVQPVSADIYDWGWAAA